MLWYSPVQRSWQLYRTLTTTDNKNQVFICLYLKVNSECDLGLRIICASADMSFLPFPSMECGRGEVGYDGWNLELPQSRLGLESCLPACCLCLWHVASLSILFFHQWNRGSNSPDLIEGQAQNDIGMQKTFNQCMTQTKCSIKVCFCGHSDLDYL